MKENKVYGEDLVNIVEEICEKTRPNLIMVIKEYEEKIQALVNDFDSEMSKLLDKHPNIPKIEKMFLRKEIINYHTAIFKGKLIGINYNEWQELKEQVDDEFAQQMEKIMEKIGFQDAEQTK